MFERVSRSGNELSRVLCRTPIIMTRTLPSYPIYAEQGFKELRFTEWLAFFGPARMSAESVAQSNAALREALIAKGTVGGLAAMAIDVSPTQPQELAARLKHETDYWNPMVKRIGFTAD